MMPSHHCWRRRKGLLFGFCLCCAKELVSFARKRTCKRTKSYRRVAVNRHQASRLCFGSCSRLLLLRKEADLLWRFLFRDTVGFGFVRRKMIGVFAFPCVHDEGGKRGMIGRSATKSRILGVVGLVTPGIRK